MEIKLKTNLKQTARLNTDIAGAITELQSVMKQFRLRKDIYRIIFRGKGLEFEGFRDFSPDDDATDIDWKTSSRARKLIVKQYREERDLKIMFLVDVGNNMVFGSGKKLKCEYAAELVSAFAKIIIENNDQVGFFIFSDGVKYFIPPKVGEKHFQFLTDILTKTSTYGGTTNLDGALDYALESLNKGIHSVILVSDFLRVTDETEKKLTLLANQYESIFIRVRDLLDFTLPDISEEMILQDPLTNEQIIVNPKIARASYEKHAYEQSKIVEDMFKKTQGDYIDLITDRSFAVPLALFLKGRLEGKG